MPVNKTLYISDLSDDTPQSIDYFQALSCEIKQTKKKSPYLSATLGDRTGKLEARMWDVPDGLKVNVGDFVKVEFVVETYRGELQLKVSRMKVVDPEEVSVGEFLPVTPYDVPIMWEKLTGLVNTIDNAKIRSAVLQLLFDYSDEFSKAPAAKSKHQGYIGGLLEHTLAIAYMVDDICNIYYELRGQTLNRSVMLAAAVVHDLGKVEELTYERAIDYSLRGSLIGHIVQGFTIWTNYDDEIEEHDQLHIRHLLLSHHGRREWGSPVVPMTREAQVFHLIDMIDSRMGIMDNTLKTVGDNGFTPFDRTLETMMWRPNGTKEQELPGTGIPEGTGEPFGEEGTRHAEGDEDGIDGPALQADRDADPATSGVS